MNNLNAALNLNLNNISIMDINEENLILLKSEDYYIQSNFYFWLINTINELEEINKIEELAYANYLMSYFVFIILTPLCYEEIAFNHIKKSIKLSKKIKFKEWLLIFSTTSKPFLSTYDSIKIAEEVLSENPNSTLAKTIIEMY
ncbi:hypothetical protein [Clostridium septicum]|uniref:Uncharacterized protein n=1 Tax=Clostridium septicum TaxID=1504 RepID=A0A9N7PK51_CLOSE|nr:hypothetical protein [Clostridium septicum]AYE35531.1 hypothetical protein CP523_14425 [Clostridium septicum]MDU1314585.1 hypothetical protein [Clostridium septicum]QAS60918.1 hypothetical protein EI377_09400 [Clostridium septicum]UEC19808.1 hypothetical protein LK444_10325 [Clostridium septicum]USS02133.1 hypothetical protein NH397_06845 [Clostridium septicum]